jgi:uncharacterized membrane protein YbhN (UPF0104 family)
LWEGADRRASIALKKVLLHVLRIVVCVGALWLVLRGLSWEDRVNLPDGRTVRVLRVEPSAVEVMDPVKGAVLVPRAVLPRDADGDVRIEHGVKSVVQRCDKRLLLFSLLLFTPVPMIQSVRLVWMLRAQDVHISYWEGVKLTYAGNLFNFVMIGTTGGDLFKAYYATQHTHHKLEAVAAIFLDRVVGLMGIVALAAVAMLFRLDDPRIRQLMPVVVLMLAGMGVGAIMYYLPVLRKVLRLGERLHWLPGLDKFRRLDRTALRMFERPKIVLGVFGCTFALQVIAVAAFTAWGLAMGMKLDAPSYYAYIGVSLVVAAIPVSFMGLGTMELALVRLFAPTNLGTKSQVVFMALGIRLVQLAWALPGVLVPLMGAHRPSPERLAELEAALQAGEES